MKVWDEVERAYRRRARHRARHRADQGRPGGRHRRPRLPARLAGRPPPGPQPRRADGQRASDAGHQGQQEARQHRAVAQGGPRRGERRSARRRRSRTSTKGKIVSGVVKNITEYGAFIDLGGIDGLLHITDMSWGRVNHPSEMFQVGRRDRVVVLKFDSREGARLARLKQRMPDPWENVDDEVPARARASAARWSASPTTAPSSSSSRASRGSIHVSEMSWTKRVKHPSKVLTVGDEVEAVVLDIDQEARRISLGLKQTEPNPWDIIEREVPRRGSRSRARSATSPTSAPSSRSRRASTAWSTSPTCPGPSAQAPLRAAQEGRRGRGRDPQDRHREPAALARHQAAPAQRLGGASSRVTASATSSPGKIVRLTDFGAFVELEEGIEGLVHVSEMAEERVEKPEDKLPGSDQEVRVKIIKMDPAEKKIGLSIKGRDRRATTTAPSCAHRATPASISATSPTSAGGRRKEKRRRGRRHEDEG